MVDARRKRTPVVLVLDTDAERRARLCAAVARTGRTTTGVDSLDALIEASADAWLVLVGTAPPGLDPLLERPRRTGGRLLRHDVADLRPAALPALLDRLERVDLPTGHAAIGRGELVSDALRVRLSPKEAALLGCLARSAGTPVSREVLHRDVWGFAPTVQSRTLDTTIRRLRSRLAQVGAGDTIATVRGLGYTLTGTAHPTGGGTDAPPLVGRDALLARIRAASGRLCTLVGPGGVGKSALARAARSADELFVALDATLTADDVVAAVASALGEATPPSAEAVGHALAARPVRHLTLDNAEQVSAEVAPLISDWLAVAPALRIRVTSREALRIADEELVWVEPLAVADPDGGLSPASTLLRLRIRQAGGTWDPVAGDRVAHCLDGLPLALEIAAAYTRLLSLDEVEHRFAGRQPDLVARRRDRPARHASLDAVLQTSWDLLTPALQAALAALARLPGELPLDGAVAAIGEGGLGHLAELRDASLVQVRSDAGTWVRLLGVVRQWLLARTDAGTAPAARYARWICARAYPWPRTPDALTALERQRDALDQAADDVGGEVALLAARLHTRAGRAAHALEVLQPLDRFDGTQQVHAANIAVWAVNDVAGPRAATALYAREQARLGTGPATAPFHRGGCWAATDVGDDAAALVAARRALQAADAGDAPGEQVLARVAVAWCLARHGRREAARATCEDVLLGVEDVRDPAHRGQALFQAAAVFEQLGDDARAGEVGGRALAQLEATGQLLLAASALGNLAGVRFRQGLVDEAEALLRRAITLCERVGVPRRADVPTGHLGLIALHRGDAAAAQEHLTSAIRGLGTDGGVRAAAQFRVLRAQARVALGEAAAARADIAWVDAHVGPDQVPTGLRSRVLG